MLSDSSGKFYLIMNPYSGSHCILFCDVFILFKKRVSKLIYIFSTNIFGVLSMGLGVTKYRLQLPNAKVKLENGIDEV